MEADDASRVAKKETPLAEHEAGEVVHCKVRGQVELCPLIRVITVITLPMTMITLLTTPPKTTNERPSRTLTWLHSFTSPPWRRPAS